LANRFGLSVRAADAGDADGVASLLAAAGVTVDRRALVDRLGESGGQSGLVLLAEDWGPPSGVLAAQWVPSLLLDLKVALVTAFVVDPLERRKGVGRLLLKAAAQAARAAKCGELHLGVPAGAAGLADFCAATGFERGGPTFVRPLRKRSA
jgi:GNAT superfamily N-acetyltransferase